MFDRIFGVTSGSAAQIRHLHARKKSVLDFLHKDATRLSDRLPSEYRPVLSTYLASVRAIELELDAPTNACGEPPAAPTGDFSDVQANYRQRYQLMHRMIALALQCGSVNAATLMYGPSSSDLTCAEVLGAGPGHHGFAHNRGDVTLMDRQRRMNQVHSGLLADLLTQLETVGVLSSTLVLYGSDMSDGDLHATENLPIALCGAGTDLRFGQVVGERAQRRPLSDLHLEVLQLLGATGVTTWGSGEMASTGQPLGLRT